MICSNRFCRFGGWSDRKSPRWGSGRAPLSSAGEGACRAAAGGDADGRWVARTARGEDFEAWDELFAGYCDFYARPSTPEHRRLVWSWIEAGSIHCLVAVAAEDAAPPTAPATGPESAAAGRAVGPPATEPESATAAGRPIGLAHARPVLSPLRGAAVGFLDDLFIAPAARGSGAFESLIAAIGDLAAAEGWPQVRWITAADNARARAAYDRLATKTDWVTYQLDV